MAFENPTNASFPSDSLTSTEVAWTQTGASGVVALAEGVAPALTAGKGKLYAKAADKNLYFLNSSGTEYQLTPVSAGSGDVVGPAASVDNEIVLFSGATGKLIKRATTTGLIKAASGVIAQAVGGTDYVVPGGVATGQTIKGGTGASETLTLSSTNNATKGNILFGAIAALDETNGRLSLGSATPPTDVAMRVYAINTSNDAISIRKASADALSSELRLTKSRGSHAGYSAVLSGDALGAIRFRGYDSVAFVGSAYIAATTTEGWTGTAHGSKIDFAVTANTTAVPAIAMTINNDKSIAMAGALSVTGHPTLEGVAATGATGTGKLVFDTSPTLVTPVLGVASATSINKVAITAPATSATLAIADGKTLTVSNSITFTATDGSTLAIGTGGTLGTGAYATIANYAPLASPTFTGTVTLPTTVLGETSLQLDAAISADGKWSGVTETGTAGATLAFGDLCYFIAASSKWGLAKADAASTSSGKIGICLLAANDTQATEILLYGKVKASTKFPTLTIGAQVYISAATAGLVVTAQPAALDNVIRVVGFGNTASELFFCPSPDYITHT